MTAERARQVCPRCRSDRIHRSRSRTPVERLVAAVTPLHLVRCRACGLRAWTIRTPPPPGAADQRDLGFPARPHEPRDEHSRRRRTRRLVLTVAGAAAFGAGVALLLA